MLKFIIGDQVRQIPDLMPLNSGIPREAVCVVGRSKVSFGLGAEGQIDLRIPDGSIVMSLPAARFERIPPIGLGVPAEA